MSNRGGTSSSSGKGGDGSSTGKGGDGKSGSPGKGGTKSSNGESGISSSPGKGGTKSSTGKSGITSSTGKGATSSSTGTGTGTGKSGSGSSTGKGGDGSSTGKGGRGSSNTGSRKDSNSYDSSGKGNSSSGDPFKALALAMIDGLMKCQGGSSGGSSSSGMDKQTSEDLLHGFTSPYSRWAWLLALAGIFQRASLEDLIYFEQTQGNLLLQLLYQVLLEDRGLGGQGMEAGAEGTTGVSVSRADVDVEECLAAISGAGVDAVVDQLRNDGRMVGIEVHTLVLLVLQCLLYKPLRTDKETLKKLQPSRLMLVDCGKGLGCEVWAGCNLGRGRVLPNTQANANSFYIFLANLTQAALPTYKVGATICNTCNLLGKTEDLGTMTTSLSFLPYIFCLSLFVLFCAPSIFLSRISSLSLSK
jgi:hypothetical protein